MPDLVWSMDWNVGESTVDAQHQGILTLINVISAARDRPISRLDREIFVHQVISELVAYAEAHFRYEEALMARIGFPDLGPHKGIHLHFRQQVIDLAAKVGGEPDGLSDLQAFLSGWLRTHILEQDHRYKPYL